MKKFSIKYQVLSIMGIFFLTYYIPTASAQIGPCPSPNPSISPAPKGLTAEGLVSAPQVTNPNTICTSSGVSVVDPKAAFAPFKIPTYEDLKSIYFTQVKDASRKQEVVTFLTPLEDQKLYHASGSLVIASLPPYTGTALVFVDGSLTINSNITGSATGGLVLIVNQDVNISQNVDQIDAVIIASGTICTAFNGISCPNTQTEKSLTINGSLISINPAKQIQFKRTLADNSKPAELINHQIKYLVLLRNTLSETLQRWSEIAGSVSLPSPAPSLPPPPPPTPTPTPTSITWYRDQDGDGYGNPSISISSVTQPAGYVSNNTDCFDVSFSVNPGQTNYFTEQRGDGSFDYNCDGIASRKYPTVANCFTSPAFTTNICSIAVTGYGNAVNTNSIGCGQFIAGNSCGSTQQTLTPWYLDDEFGGCFNNGSYVSQVEGTPTSPSYTVNLCR